MHLSRIGVLVMVIAIAPLGAQAPGDSSEPMRVGPGVTAPRVIRKVEPEYSAEARANYIQGSVLLQIVVDEKGRATDISVISPLGFGLDEQAQAAVSKWEFVPGMRAGAPVKILATVEVNFRFLGIWFDQKIERQRTSFNVALRTLSQPNSTPAAVDSAVKSIIDLHRHKFVPAIYLAGLWLLNGEHGPKDEAAGLELIHKAAAKHYGPALYEIAIRRVYGRDLPADLDKGLQEMREAATLGSAHAQFHLGVRYEKGDGVPRELDRARRYYRLCAAQGVAVCQYRLGRLLYDAPERREREYLQAIALIQLAAEQNMAEAKILASNETSKLTTEQRSSVEALKRQIVRK